MDSWAEDCRKKAMEWSGSAEERSAAVSVGWNYSPCSKTVERRQWSVIIVRLCAKIDAIGVLYSDLVYQWRQIADEFEVLERAKLKGADERA